MTCIATEANWSQEQAYKIAKFSADFTHDYITKEQTLAEVMNTIEQSDFSTKDKLFMALAFGAFMSSSGAFG